MVLTFVLEDTVLSWQQWCIPLIPALSRQRQEDLCEFKANLVYTVSSRTARTTQRNLVLKKQNNKMPKEEKTVIMAERASVTEQVKIPAMKA